MVYFSLNSNDIYNIIKRIRDIISQNKNYLTELDAAIGDADHGINMDRGFGLAVERLSQINNIDNTDIGTILMTVANALLETVGGAAGPLYGMFFMNMATVASGKREIDIDTLVKMFKEGLKGVQDVGGNTQPGEKTMVDTLYPFVHTLENSLERGDDIFNALDNAIKAAEKGMLSTIDMIAKKGRASYLGERSRGHQDPGATSSYLILKTFYDYIKDKLNRQS
ncbi:dihydroxyacetone kinase subunit DhaL [Pyrobaculum sp.]|uniref:dihydroxyacetone kinase subunit DhaL n=1 Tax=Pyrobaculum sp. TaxID=2004705 RepID=UPI00316D59AC